MSEAYFDGTTFDMVSGLMDLTACMDMVVNVSSQMHCESGLII